MFSSRIAWCLLLRREENNVQKTYMSCCWIIQSCTACHNIQCICRQGDKLGAWQLNKLWRSIYMYCMYPSVASWRIKYMSVFRRHKKQTSFFNSGQSNWTLRHVRIVFAYIRNCVLWRCNRIHVRVRALVRFDDSCWLLYENNSNRRGVPLTSNCSSHILTNRDKCNAREIQAPINGMRLVLETWFITCVSSHRDRSLLSTILDALRNYFTNNYTLKFWIIINFKLSSLLHTSIIIQLHTLLRSLLHSCAFRRLLANIILKMQKTDLYLRQKTTRFI